MTDQDLSGVILLRTWVQDGQVVTRLHAALPGMAEQTTVVRAGVESCLEVVRAWLEAMETSTAP